MGGSLDGSEKPELVTLHEAVRIVAEKSLPTKDWSGLPLPVPGLDLVIEPRFRRKDMENFRWKSFFTPDGVEESLPEEPPAEPNPWKTVNSWWSEKLHAQVHVLKNDEGRARHGLIPRSALFFTLNTLAASQAWPAEAERKALEKLATFISRDDHDQYFLTGQFEERSRRSGLRYLFRRGRPTVVLKEVEEDCLLPLCALCLHPIGYYAESWAGVMCPTDEVIAHLLMMRGSEEKFWAQANQHSIMDPAAGI